MKITKLMRIIKNSNSGGYFYADNCRIIWGLNWYCKDFENGIMKTYNISQREVIQKISTALPSWI